MTYKQEASTPNHAFKADSIGCYRIIESRDSRQDIVGVLTGHQFLDPTSPIIAGLFLRRMFRE